MSKIIKKYGILVGALIVIVGIGVWLMGPKAGDSLKINNSSMTPTPTPTNGTATTCVPKTFTADDLKNAKSSAGDTVILNIKDFGQVTVKLALKDAPKTSDNFKKLVGIGFYNCLTFHRIAPGFVIQGGDPKGDGTGGPGFTIPAEIGLKHKRGSVAMARLPDTVNPKQESSGSQFYIALGDLPSLDGKYTVFGEVVGGMDVVDKIAKSELIPAGVPDGPPLAPVVIEKAELVGGN